MTTKKTTTGKGGAKKLTLKKETIRDLSLKNKAKNIKGGRINNCSPGVTWCVTATCNSGTKLC
jgi:hypothetical protein